MNVVKLPIEVQKVKSYAEIVKGTKRGRYVPDTFALVNVY